ncbi:methyltransferase domain-containing protein [Colletotrichum musicola]|uniref:Methyltransferase domain-containing protein n=1 Tax=Colletotrichum musicola TaxID=2175873 RepID=A0A8H6J1F9_9PEZI|nr:methyltransferase domain-containing protein [Colletotrichum musicola]
MMVMATGHKLYCAPLQPERVHNILDIGTGTGICEFKCSLTKRVCQITGIDLSANQTRWIPSNVKFMVDDIESPWIESRKYDFIMCRYMGASIKDWPNLMRNIYDHLTPGGWAEFQDVNTKFYSQDSSYTDATATARWMSAFMAACASTGRDPSVGPKLEGWVRESAGFTNISSHVLKVPLGPWARHQYYKDLGMMNLMLTLDGLEALSLKLFAEMLGWTEERIAGELEAVREELKSCAFRALFDIHVVYAQKPPHG